MRSVLAIVLLATASVASGFSRTSQADPTTRAFAVGALRRDGIVIPFAVFDGKRWSKPWPLPSLDPSIPINVTSVPSRWWGSPGPRESWQAWTGSEPKTIRVRQPDAVDVHCTRQIGLRTDYRPAEPAPPWSEQPYPKDGIAISPPHPLEPIAILKPAEPELLPIREALKAAFDKAERETAGRFNHPVNQKTRESFDPEIEAAYAHGSDPRVYYVEATRAYRQLGGCTVAFGTGWFARDGDTFKPLAMTVDVLGCDKYGATYMYPFGVMTLAGKTYWLAQFSGWDHERFVVVEIRPKEVFAIVNAWGGGC
jgi:hypothetical protein